MTNCIIDRTAVVGGRRFFARNILALVARHQTTFGDLLSASSVPDVLCSVSVKPGSVPSVLSAIPCGDDEDELVA
jgi:hypothetical protein